MLLPIKLNFDRCFRFVAIVPIINFSSKHCEKYLTRRLSVTQKELELTMCCRFVCLALLANNLRYSTFQLFVYAEIFCSKSSQPWLRQPRNKRTASSSHEQPHDTQSLSLAARIAVASAFILLHNLCGCTTHTHQQHTKN